MKKLLYSFVHSILLLGITTSLHADDEKQIHQLIQHYKGEKEILFDGSNMMNWVWHHSQKTSDWKIIDGVLEVMPKIGNVKDGDNSIVTVKNYENFYLHLEFKPNTTPKDNKEQDRGNSGVMLQDRYELQILDSHDHPLERKNDCGAFYKIANASTNAAKPTGEWQSYDIFFTAPKWKRKKKIANARVTVFWNGVLIHDDIELPKNTAHTKKEAATPGPIRLQEHAHKVQFRNIWLKTL